MSDSAEQAADALIKQDPWLEPYREGLIGRYSRYAHLRELLMSSTQNPEADVSLFSAYNYLGLKQDQGPLFR